IDFKGSSFNIKNDLDETRTMHFDNLDAFTDFVDESKKRYEEYVFARPSTSFPAVCSSIALLETIKL
ncbi:hypothetical protein, partial [Cesiribacter sp. SM1]|uniref:hypothetical protein n=1 Tax=Cesiribacter sp. SM1 TaxID=2861196 RepID=UPI001CD2DB18